MPVPKHTEELLEDLAASLQVPPNRYESAERSYKAMGEWLRREASPVRKANPKIYIQGSFGLGTANRPASGQEDYDVDLVCELAISKTQLSQEQLKAGIGKELHSYAEAHNMKAPTEGRRCWTQDYADGAQFHIDVLPALPDARYQRLLLAQHGFSSEWIDTAIAITDREDRQYRSITNEWPTSNPKGYASWFRSKMQAAFDARRRALALEARASIEEIPDFKVRTPLQSAVQILKRHRDVMFLDRKDAKPISIIVTTLAAHAYRQEPTISSGLYGILSRMDAYIEDRDGVAWIGNPTDPRENFADRWRLFPERRQAFYEWLDRVRTDFRTAAKTQHHARAMTVLSPILGKDLIDAAASKRSRSFLDYGASTKRLRKALNPAHRTAPPWDCLDQGDARIKQAQIERPGLGLQLFQSNGAPLPKQCGLRFQADTSVPWPYSVFWQVVNTGAEAKAADGLRGGFDEGLVTLGLLTKEESTLYAGTHSIECFIVKNGYLAARSGQFIVNIQ